MDAPSQIKGLRGDVHWYVAQAILQIDAEIAEKGHFWMETNETRRISMKEGLTFVMGVNLIVWCGIAFYLFILDRRIKKLEQTPTNKSTTNNKIGNSLAI